MKVLSLLQPWASLLAHGIKLVETRSWITKHREDFAIHASGPNKPFYPRMVSKYWPDDLEAQKIVLELLRQIGFEDPNAPMPAGKIIGVGKVKNCREMTLSSPANITAPELMFSIPTLTKQEYLLGHYEAGRYAWDIEDAKPIDEPIIFKGGLNFSKSYDGPLLVKGVNVNL